MFLASDDPDAHYERGPGNTADDGYGASYWLGQGSGYGMASIIDNASQELAMTENAGITPWT